MCGISGIWDYDNRYDARRLVEQMNNRQQHRGPDYQDIKSLDNITFGHTRLAIIDLDARANQPMISPDRRFILTFNGEIYNYRTLKKQLEPDFPFKTESDTEVVLAAFQKWGHNCVSKFNGMFAFAVFDTQKNELFLARDRMGIKPLYFIYETNYFLFASEIRSLIATGLFKPSMRYASFIEYLRYQTVYAPNTILEQVQMLESGTYLVINEDGDAFKTKYWQAETTVIQPHLSYDEVKTKIKDKFFTAVEKRMIADVPLGAFLSGGIDSSAVVAAMASQSDTQISTFSVGFKEDEFNESQYAEAIARKYRTAHQTIMLTADDFLHTIPQAVSAIDHPTGDGINTYVVSQATKQAGLTVALSGLGGDELFAGYPLFKQLIHIKEKKWILPFPGIVKKLFAQAYIAKHKSAAAEKQMELLKLNYFDLPDVYPYIRLMLTDKHILNLVKPNVPKGNYFEWFHSLVGYDAKGFELPFLSRISVLEMLTYMQHTLLRDTDQMSMAHALEVRVPFLDHELVEFVLGVKDEYKYPYSPKQLFTDSMGDLLPSEIINRPKMGFVLPWEKWMKTELRPFVEQHLQSFKQRDFINEKYVDFMWQKFLSGDQRFTWARIWYLVVLENWLNSHNVTIE